jgi:hypothetical protein
MRGRRNTDAQNAPVHSPALSTPRIGDMTHPDGGSDADNHPHSGPAAFDLTKPFEAVRTLIRRYAEDTETPVAIDPATGAQMHYRQPNTSSQTTFPIPGYTTSQSIRPPHSAVRQSNKPSSTPAC